MDNISSMPAANSSSLGETTLKPIVNATLAAMNNASRANISGSSTVEVYEGHDVTLSFVFESYPPVNFSNSHSSVHVESYTTKNNRFVC